MRPAIQVELQVQGAGGPYVTDLQSSRRSSLTLAHSCTLGRLISSLVSHTRRQIMQHVAGCHRSYQTTRKLDVPEMYWRHHQHLPRVSCLPATGPSCCLAAVLQHCCSHGSLKASCQRKLCDSFAPAFSGQQMWDISSSLPRSSAAVAAGGAQTAGRTCGAGACCP